MRESIDFLVKIHAIRGKSKIFTTFADGNGKN
ncbi:MAG: hypothetical protein RIS64_1432 [Bacteroidota bacterium]|jgi:hypothetical protein